MDSGHSEAEKAYKKKTFEDMARAIIHFIPPEKRPEIPWGAIKTKALAEIDERIALARSIGKAPEQLDQEWVDAANAKLHQTWEILRNGYVIDKAEFEKTILPIIFKLGFAPDASETCWDGEPIGDVIFLSSSSVYAVSSAARDSLRGKCDDFSISKFAQTLRANYETLRKAKIAGHQHIKGLCNRHVCEQCKKLDGKLMLISELLADYHNHSPAFPHELPWDDVPQWCDGPFFMPSRPGMSKQESDNLVAEFLAWK